MTTRIVIICMLVLISVWNAHAVPFTFTYDGLGRMTDFTLPAGNQITYGYDANGNRKQEKIVIQAAFDPDSDGLPNVADNCTAKANVSQKDVDKDGKGDACDAMNWGQFMAGYYTTIGNKDGLTTEQFMINNGLSSATQVASLSAATTNALVRVHGPSGMAYDATSDRLYFAEQTNQLIRHVALATGQTTKMAGSGNLWMKGYVDAVGAAARFSMPQQVASSPDGAWLYVADYGNCAIRRINTTTHAVSTYAGVAPCPDDGVLNPSSTSHQDGSAQTAKFYWPRGVAVGADGTVYVGDSHNRAIRKISTSGTVTTLAGGPGNTIGMARPHGITLIGSDLYVADGLASVIWKVNINTGATSIVVGKLNTWGAKAGVVGSEALLMHPVGIVGSGTTLYVVDQAQNALFHIDIANHYFTTLLTGGSTKKGYLDGSFADAQFDLMQWVTLDSSDNTLYVSDPGNQAIRKLNLGPKTVTTLLGLPEIKNKYMDGDGAVARFYSPRSIVRVDDDTFLVTDGGNCLIRKLTLDPGYGQVVNGKFNHSLTVSTFAGTPSICTHWFAWTTSFPLDISDKPNGASAIFYAPSSMTIDSTQTFAYIAGQDRTIRRMAVSAASGSAIGATHFVAGAPVPEQVYYGNMAKYAANVDGQGTSAKFNAINDVVYVDETVSGGGTTPVLYVLATNAVRRISLANGDYGTVTTVFGHPTEKGDQNGVGTNARFTGLKSAVPLSRNGTQFLYVTDTLTHKLYELNLQTKQVKTVAGSGTQSSTDGVGLSASFNSPSGITAATLSDNVTYLYVGDNGSSKLRMIDADTWEVTTIAGSNASGASDGVGTASDWNIFTGMLYVPAHHRIFIADSWLSTLRQLTPDLPK
jgi:YD repeat-containing protein